MAIELDHNTSDLSGIAGQLGIRRRNLKKMAASGQVAMGLMVQIPDPMIAELAGLAGYDFLRVDGAHFLFDLEPLGAIVRVADMFGMPVLVRIHDISTADTLLDFGVTGFTIANVRTAEQARAIVSKLKFAPLGSRGMSGSGRAQAYEDIPMPEVFRRGNDEVVIVAQIEDAEGLANMDKIFAVEGIDFVNSGRNDLSQAFGVPGQMSHPLVVEAEEKMFRAATKAGVAIALSAGSPDRIKEGYDLGARVFAVAGDMGLLRRGMRSHLDELRGTAAELTGKK